jgi:hypothetical protein
MPPDDWVCKLESGPNVVTVVQEIFS